MAQKILGIDLGTNSIGIAVRNTDLGKNIVDQIEYETSIIFKSGVGVGKSGEFSYAAERTKYRSSRRLYQSRKYRIWATLKLLIQYDCCPLSEEELNRWAKYDKENGLTRQYPIDATSFEQWIRLDFDGDGVADYSSPYQLRAELVERKLDWNNQTDRYKFGRAMYHIAQRRGFKSSKGETLKDAKETDDITTLDVSESMKKSELKKSQDIKDFMDKHHLPTVGSAFALLEKKGYRIRNSNYQAVQSQYRDEVQKICQLQGLDKTHPDFYLGLYSTKRNEGTIFFRRPLRSQKGLVGKCTLEPTKRRCPISHPDYEEFRAWSFINNIRFKLDPEGEWLTLSDDERKDLFDKLFTRAKSTFKFEEVRKWLENIRPGHTFNHDDHTINYRDHTTVSGCPIINRLEKILGECWQTATIPTTKERTNTHTGEIHPIQYNYEDLWHLCYSSDDYEELAERLQKQTELDDKAIGEVIRMWSILQEGYTSLSLKAIRNILPFLREGLIYSEAVAIAKIPDIIGTEQWEKSRTPIITSLRELSLQQSHLRLIYGVTNSLIADYKSQTLEESNICRNTDYILNDSDKHDIKSRIIQTISLAKWSQTPPSEQHQLLALIEDKYQQFFSDPHHDYYKIPQQREVLKAHLAQLFPAIHPSQWDKLYHHSQISIFPQQERQVMDVDDRKMLVFQLGKPDIGAIKNPVALRALHILRRSINGLLSQGIIDETTRVVVETARDLNDANWRKAIELYQKEREKENKAIIDIILNFRNDYSDTDIAKGRLLFEQNVCEKSSRNDKIKAERFARDIQKIKLWKEQSFQCLYTGRFISVAELFNGNTIQIEHTIPRSISFDDSLKNKTICDTHFNAKVKGNHIPSELSNHVDILQRIQPWKDKVEHIKSQIELWKAKSRTATTVERKNECIQQKHLWELELDYWESKVKTFTVKKDELDLGFRNSQLVDTRIITKYAFHYLKSVFTRVDVQKGTITATFRKILGVQSVDEKKDRQKHSHHAIDAAVLTLIPSAAKRDKIIELFYSLQDAHDSEKEPLSQKLAEEIRSCHLGSVNGLVDYIEQNILVNHVYKDQTLSPAKKPRRIGRHRIKNQWLQGDSIRGSLHQDTFYGAIQSIDKDIVLVVRKPLKGLSEKDLNNIVDPALRKSIKTQIKQLMEKGLSFAKAIEENLYMLDKEGNPVKQDRNGRPLSPIRHVRCLAPAGRGFLQKDTALIIKRQTYPSKQDYKNFYYAQNDDNYLCLFYQGSEKGKTSQEFRLLNYLDAARLNLSDVNALFTEPEFSTYNGNPRMPLRAIIKKGTRVLFYTKNPEEVRDLDNNQLSKRFYIVYKYNIMRTPNIYLKHHLEARKEKECDSSECGTTFNPSKTLSYLSCKANNFKALIEHYHFEVDPLGNITFK